MADDDTGNIRDTLSHFVGQRILEITQHDPEAFVSDGLVQVCLHMEDGLTLCFWIDDEGVDILFGGDENSDDE